MPTYTYVCTLCEHRFDAQQSFVDAALTTCPECDGQLRKLFGNVGVVFKGPGFYRTDARAGNGRNGKPSKRSEATSSVPATSGSSSSSNGSSSNGSSSNDSSSGNGSGNGSSSNGSTSSNGSSTSTSSTPAASPAAASA